MTLITSALRQAVRPAQSAGSRADTRTLSTRTPCSAYGPPSRWVVVVVAAAVLVAVVAVLVAVQAVAVAVAALALFRCCWAVHRSHRHPPARQVHSPDAAAATASEIAPQPMQQTWTVLQRDGPNHLGFVAGERDRLTAAGRAVALPEGVAVLPSEGSE